MSIFVEVRYRRSGRPQHCQVIVVGRVLVVFAMTNDLCVYMDSVRDQSRYDA